MIEKQMLLKALAQHLKINLAKLIGVLFFIIFGGTYEKFSTTLLSPAPLSFSTAYGSVPSIGRFCIGLLSGLTFNAVADGALGRLVLTNVLKYNREN